MWLIADITAIESPVRAESVAFWLMLMRLVNLLHFRGRGATLCSGDIFLDPKNLSQDHSMKLKWLVVNVTAVGSPTRAESADFGLCLMCLFGKFWAVV